MRRNVAVNLGARRNLQRMLMVYYLEISAERKLALLVDKG